MKISLNWLKQYIDLKQEATEIASILTDLGLEVEAVEPFETVKGNLNGVVLGEVLTREKHPDADKLSLCTVDVGNEAPLQIVCGAPNVAAGQKVAVALVGTTLYPTEGEPITLKKSKIRGVESQGMICAEDELGLGESHDGILVLTTDKPNGTPAAEIFDLYSDTVFEIGLTPNRTDAMCHYGVARDLAARLDLPLKDDPNFSKTLVSNGLACPVSVQVVSSERCPRYTGGYLEGVKVGESPLWLKNFLAAVGQRSINNIVDITNYVLLGIGQPLHAFDADAVSDNKIIVRTAAEGEKFLTLDEKERTLSANDLMICDAQKPLCMAGVMGGLNSGTTEKTTRVFIESAYFAPDGVRATARRHGIHSETSYRFERGTDPNATPKGLELALKLIQDLAGGTTAQTLDMKAVESFEPFKINFSYSKANQLIGLEIPKETVNSLFRRLDIKIESTDNQDVVVALVPRYRVDVQRQQDLVEELLRVYGFNEIPSPEYFSVPLLAEAPPVAFELQNRVSDLLAAVGFNEMVTNSLVGRKYKTETSVEMLNPMSEDHAIMRESLLISGLEVIAFNVNRKEQNLRLFDFGKIYYKTPEGYGERLQLALYVTGKTHEPHWQSKPTDSSFFTLKREMERLQAFFALNSKEVDAETPDPAFAYERWIVVGKEIIARYGQVQPSELKVFDLKQPVYHAIVEWEALLKYYNRKKIEYVEPPRFPVVNRDLSLIVPEEVAFEQIRQTIVSIDKKLVRSVEIFDVYVHPETKERSYAVSIALYNEERTLEDKEIQGFMAKAIEKLEQKGLRVRS